MICLDSGAVLACYGPSEQAGLPLMGDTVMALRRQWRAVSGGLR